MKQNNITLRLKNITGHLTGAKKIITLCFITLTLCFFNAPHSSALTYQQDIPVSFTFNSSIILTLSSADLRINNLVPGTVADSNIITVSATSNNSTGYVVTATVGDNTHSNPSFSNTSLNHKSNTGSTFTSLATNASLANITNDNTWGYTISDDGNTWANYSGLPIYTSEAGKTLKESNTNGTTSFQFKIGAKASNTQPSGEYNNVINFTVTSNPRPMEISDLAYMQDFATLSETDMATVLASMNLEQQYQLQDSRDNKTYYISKLLDGNVWMTQNLDHDIDSTKTYTPADTDIPANWTPSTSTYATSNTTWNGSTTTPESSDPGTLYWTGTADSDGSVWQAYRDSCDDSGCNESLNPLTNGTLVSTTGNSHYHLGNYYNWTAAMAMNDSSSYTTTRDILIDQSICPAGWTLPRAGYGEDTFYGLWSEYGYDYISKTFSNISTLTGSPIYFTPADGWGGSLRSVGSGGSSWSPVPYYLASFNMHSGASPSFNATSDTGVSVRCVARPVTSTLRWSLH